MALRIPLIQINGRLRELPTGDQIPTELIRTYEFTQSEPSLVWIINHNMNKFPAVTIVLSDGSSVYADVHYISNNRIDILFKKPTDGRAYLN